MHIPFISQYFTQVLSILVLIFSLTANSKASSDNVVENKEDCFINLFLDCSSCDIDYIKNEIVFVNYMRDIADADLHLLITTAQAGSMGVEFILSFKGLKGFSGTQFQLKYVASLYETEANINSRIVKEIKMGLAPFLSQTCIEGSFDISYTEKEAKRLKSDKWGNWTFTTELSAGLKGEEHKSSQEGKVLLDIDKVVDEYKNNLTGFITLNREEYSLDGEEIKSNYNEYGLTQLYVHSLNDYFSLGGLLSYKSSTYTNMEHELEISPAIEYNIFPYREYYEHEFSFLLRPFLKYNNYFEETIYDKFRETLSGEELQIAFSQVKEWGSCDLSLTTLHYFYDLSKNRITFDAKISVRLFSGFSITFGGNIAMIRDQIYLAKVGSSTEEVLLAQRELETSYNYSTSLGISYTFGSLYNNVVNTRF